MATPNPVPLTERRRRLAAEPSRDPDSKQARLQTPLGTRAGVNYFDEDAERRLLMRYYQLTHEAKARMSEQSDPAPKLSEEALRERADYMMRQKEMIADWIGDWIERGRDVSILRDRYRYYKNRVADYGTRHMNAYPISDVEPPYDDDTLKELLRDLTDNAIKEEAAKTMRQVAALDEDEPDEKDDRNLSSVTEQKGSGKKKKGKPKKRKFSDLTRRFLKNLLELLKQRKKKRRAKKRSKLSYGAPPGGVPSVAASSGAPIITYGPAVSSMTPAAAIPPPPQPPYNDQFEAYARSIRQFLDRPSPLQHQTSREAQTGMDFTELKGFTEQPAVTAANQQVMSGQVNTVSTPNTDMPQVPIITEPTEPTGGVPPPSSTGPSAPSIAQVPSTDTKQPTPETAEGKAIRERDQENKIQAMDRLIEKARLERLEKSRLATEARRAEDADIREAAVAAVAEAERKNKSLKPADKQIIYINAEKKARREKEQRNRPQTTSTPPDIVPTGVRPTPNPLFDGIVTVELPAQQTFREQDIPEEPPTDMDIPDAPPLDGNASIPVAPSPSQGPFNPFDAMDTSEIQATSTQSTQGSKRRRDEKEQKAEKKEKRDRKRKEPRDALLDEIKQAAEKRRRQNQDIVKQEQKHPQEEKHPQEQPPRPIRDEFSTGFEYPLLRLNYTNDLTEAGVQRAFKEAILDIHPDKSNLPTAAARTAKLYNERKALLDTIRKRRQREGKGSGMDLGGRGIDNYDIDKVMNRYKGYYVGTRPWDMMEDLPWQARSKNFCVLNLDRSTSNKGGTHWVGLLMDARPGGDGTIEYFDSLGRAMPDKIRPLVRRVAKRMQFTEAPILKENLRRVQNAVTDTCGPRAMAFGMARYRNKSFKEASGFNDVQNIEAYPKFAPFFVDSDD